jgi:hypothetical protein
MPSADSIDLRATLPELMQLRGRKKARPSRGRDAFLDVMRLQQERQKPPQPASPPSWSLLRGHPMIANRL